MQELFLGLTVLTLLFKGHLCSHCNDLNRVADATWRKKSTLASTWESSFFYRRLVPTIFILICFEHLQLQNILVNLSCIGLVRFVKIEAFL